jgi:hypothetical protein
MQRHRHQEFIRFLNRSRSRFQWGERSFEILHREGQGGSVAEVIKPAVSECIL